jgi:hypothetical protein
VDEGHIVAGIDPTSSPPSSSIQSACRQHRLACRRGLIVTHVDATRLAEADGRNADGIAIGIVAQPFETADERDRGGGERPPFFILEAMMVSPSGWPGR